MALYLKRLKGNRLIVDNLITHPIKIANDIIVPAKRYLDEQYAEVSSREPLISHAKKDNVMPVEDDFTFNEDELLNSPEYWWNVDYLEMFQEKYPHFKEIVDGIKNGTIQKTAEVVDELNQTYKECTIALAYICLQYAFYFESMLFLCGEKPKEWWILYDSLTNTESLSTRDGWVDPGSVPQGYSTIYKVGGRLIADYMHPEWQDYPGDFDVHWWERLLHPFSSEDDIRGDKMDNRWANFLKFKQKSGWRLGDQVKGVQYFKRMNSSQLKKTFGSMGVLPPSN